MREQAQNKRNRLSAQCEREAGALKLAESGLWVWEGEVEFARQLSSEKRALLRKSFPICPGCQLRFFLFRIEEYGFRCYGTNRKSLKIRL